MASIGADRAVPEVALRSSDARPMPMVGMGTAQFPVVHETTKDAVLAAIEVGYRHFDTAFLYGTEKPLGEAAAEAIRRGLVRSREELFVTSKLWCTQNHPDLVLPSLRETLNTCRAIEQEPADGVRGPVPDPLAGLHQARAAQVPEQEGGRHAVGHRGRVACHGGVPAAGPRQGDRREQFHHQAPRQGAVRRHDPACGEPGGAEPGVAAADAEGVLRRQGHPRRGLLAAGRAELGRTRQRRAGLRGARRDCQGQRENRRTGIYAVERLGLSFFLSPSSPALSLPTHHPDLVLPSLRETLNNLQMEYVDLYLIHWPVYINGPARFPNKKEDAMPLDIEGVWRAMEECQRLGLAKAIGVSNYTTKHLDRVLAVATILPAVNQVELNPVWQQPTLRAYCADRGIHVAAYSPLGGQNWDGKGNAVLDSEVLAEIAKARGKTIAQVALRWIHEQGVTCIVKSYNKERLKQNLEIFDWELTDEDRLKISQIPQKKVVQTTISGLFLEEGEFTSVDPAELNIVEE